MLTPRLNCIINYVNADVAADIGTDHAYIPIELIRRKRAHRAIASDVRPGPLRSAMANISRYGLGSSIETRLGSGMSVLLPGEAEVIIAAGMGGELISEMICADEETARASRLILQPMNAQYELRHFLIERGFTIECEDIASEGQRVYNLMLVKNGAQQPFSSDIEYHIPLSLRGHDKFEMLFNKKKREFEKIIKGLEESKICDTQKLDYYRNRLNDLKELM